MAGHQSLAHCPAAYLDTLHIPSVSEPFLAWITSGEVDFQEREDGQPWITNRIKKGSFFLTTGGAPYDVRWRAVSPEPYETMLVFVELPVLQRALEEVFGTDATHARLRDASAFNDEALNSLLGLLREELMRPKASPLFVEAIAQAVAIHLARSYGVTDEESHSSSPSLPGHKLRQINAANTKNPVSIGDGPYPAEGMAAYSPTGPHKLMRFQRRAPGPKDVAIKIHYCGVCHSDIHTIREDWGKIQYPQIVGHEIAGEVVAVGSSVSKFNVGARVGVGTMVNSCRVCTECQAGHENYCLNGNTQTYGSKDKDGTISQGGYSTFVVVDEDFVINIPAAIDLAEAGPLLCAGITVYSPLRRWGVSPGKKVAIVGMGGLGHLAVKLATALGAEVTVFTTSLDKTSDARRFGAKDVVVNKEGADFSKLNHAFDFALDTVPYKHDLNRFIPLLKRDAVYCRAGVGKVVDSNEIGQMNLVLYRNALAGSNTGGIRETQEFVDFCALNKIKPEVTKISMNGIDDAWTKVFEKKARYRYVMDMKA